MNGETALVLAKGYAKRLLSGIKGEKGDPFTVAKTYATIADMNADFNNPAIAEGSFVVITSHTEDEDNAKLYIKGATAYAFITDMSGIQGIKGDAGTNGVDGITPYVGANGNWFFNGVDTGVNARGLNDTQIRMVTLTAADWDANLTQSVPVQGIVADDLKQVVDIAPTEESAVVFHACGIECSECGTDTLVFTANYVPQTDVNLYVVINNTTEELIRDVYFTEEQVVGTWIDGKPIYRQVIVTTAPTVVTNGTYVFSTIPLGCSVDYVFPATGAVLQSSTQVYPIPYISNSGDGQVKTYIDKSINSVRFGTNLTGFNRCQATLIVEYTKTTDTATTAIPSATAMAASYDEGVNEA